MIDMLKIRLEICHDVQELKSSLGITTDLTRHYAKIKNRYGCVSRIISLCSGTVLEIQGNPSKWFQGHNIYGSNNIQPLAYDYVTSVLNQCGINPIGNELRALQSGRYQLLEVHIAGEFRIKKNISKSELIREIAIHCVCNGLEVSVYDFESIYLNQHSRRSSTKLYDKKQEIELPRRVLPLDLPNRNLLLRRLQNSLRYERVLRSQELKRLKLDQLCNWNRDSVLELARQGVSRFMFNQTLKQYPVESIPLDSLPRHLRLTY